MPQRGTDEVRPLGAAEALTGEKEVEVEVEDEEELCAWRCRALLKWILPPRSHHTLTAF